MSLNLPQCDHTDYVVEFRYKGWIKNNSKLKINVCCPLFDEIFPVDHYFVRSYGSVKIFGAQTMVRVDIPFILKYPQVLPDVSRKRLMAIYKKQKAQV